LAGLRLWEKQESDRRRENGCKSVRFAEDSPRLDQGNLQRAEDQPNCPYDLIVAIEAANTTEILTTVMRDIRPAAGVRDTVTCLVVPGENLE
jgi:negative regulator of replication initiation